MTKPKRLELRHPGLLLKDDLAEIGLSAYRVCKETGISQVTLGKILKGQRSISVDTGLRLARFLGMSDNFFSGLQQDYDIEKAKGLRIDEYAKIQKYAV